MANPAHRLPQNIDGHFFVDSSCIDCDTCRQIAPETFRDHGGQASVYSQPQDEAEQRRSLMALAACPTGSIGTTKEYDRRIGVDAFPSMVTNNIFFCGFTAESSFGAWSYLIVRPAPEGGNVLVDSPRYVPPLARRIGTLGGISRIFLTHRDDVADHARYAETFTAPRIMHSADGAARLGIEQVIEGKEPVMLEDDLLAIPVPGHTRGSVVLLYKERFLFTGDHLAWSPRRNTLTAFRNACWYSWERQIESMERLLDYRFEWVLPGHGRIGHANADSMRDHLQGCIEWMRTR